MNKTCTPSGPSATRGKPGTWATFFTLVLSVSGFLLGGCRKTAVSASNMENVNLSVSQTAEILKQNPQVQLIDVRTGFEWNRGHIAGAQHIPVDEIASRLQQIDRSRPVLLYCAAGGRSHYALEILKKAGFADVKHLASGISGWKAAGMQTVQ